jgi:hypothetical protein
LQRIDEYVVHVVLYDQSQLVAAEVSHARSHSVSVQSRPPTVAHAAWASPYVTFVHGIRVGSEQARCVIDPCAVASPSGRDAS